MLPGPRVLTRRRDVLKTLAALPLAGCATGGGAPVRRPSTPSGRPLRRAQV